jgi:hypothetical protein
VLGQVVGHGDDHARLLGALGQSVLPDHLRVELLVAGAGHVDLAGPLGHGRADRAVQRHVAAAGRQRVAGGGVDARLGLDYQGLGRAVVADVVVVLEGVGVVALHRVDGPAEDVHRLLPVAPFADHVADQLDQH